MPLSFRVSVTAKAEGQSPSKYYLFLSYMSDKLPTSINLYEEQESMDQHSNHMIIEVATPNAHLQQPQQILLPGISGGDTTSSGGEDNNNNNLKLAPKKRAETWVQEETRAFISLGENSPTTTTKSHLPHQES